MSPDPILALSGLSKSFGGISALRDVSIEVPRARIVGVIGPNGAGKTTLFNLVTGAIRPSAGDIVFDGRSIRGLPPHRIARRGIARTFQNIRLFAGMTVWEHLLVAQRVTGPRRLLPAGWADREARRQAEDVMNFFALGHVRHRLAASLPYGIQRKVEMARALVAEPKLLLLDEPVAGMNADEAEALRRLLLALRDRGLTILLIEHDMPFVMNLCDRLHVLDFGTLIAAGEPAAIRCDPRVLDAYLGEDA